VNLNGRWHVIIGEPFFFKCECILKRHGCPNIFNNFFFVKLILVILVKSYFTSQSFNEN
jgi:hypothetical protein